MREIREEECSVGDECSDTSGDQHNNESINTASFKQRSSYLQRSGIVFFFYIITNKQKIF